MIAGRMRDRITIQQVSTADDSYGQPIETWSTYAERWASVEPVSGRETYTEQQLGAESTTKVQIRLDEDVTTQMRVSLDSRTLEIVATENWVAQGRTVLWCKEWAE